MRCARRGPSVFQPCPCGGRHCPNRLVLAGPGTLGVYGRGNCRARISCSTHRTYLAGQENRLSASVDRRAVARAPTAGASAPRGCCMSLGLQPPLRRVRAVGLAADHAAVEIAGIRADRRGQAGNDTSGFARRRGARLGLLRGLALLLRGASWRGMSLPRCSCRNPRDHLLSRSSRGPRRLAALEIALGPRLVGHQFGLARHGALAGGDVAGTAAPRSTKVSSRVFAPILRMAPSRRRSRSGLPAP
jgi:hypothetical protein